MNREEQILIKRFHDLADAAYNRGIATFSDYLNLNEISHLNTILKDISYVKVVLNGGYPLAERQIAAFVPDAFLPQGEQLNYPVTVLKITPLNQKFAEKLTHRDFLGAILNLGIDRSKIGDILVKESAAYIFVHNSMKEFLKSELTRIKHTSVKIEETTEIEEISPEFLHMEGSVSSERIDAVIAFAFSTSRSALSGLTTAEKVFLNGKVCYSNSQPLKQGDIVSVRGFGKFVYGGMISTTKKGRCFIALDKYI